MVEKWIHLNDMGGDPWVLPIWTSVREAIRKGKVKDIPRELSEYGLYISTRLDMLPHILSRIRGEISDLRQAIDAHELKHEFTEESAGVAFSIPDQLKYRLLIDIDSLLFELNALCELMLEFVVGLHKLAGTKITGKPDGRFIKAVLDEAKHDSTWFVTLDRHRNFFIHEGTPYLAVDITPSLGGIDVLIMKENLTSFVDEKKFLRLSEIEKIVIGFDASMKILQSHLRQLFT